MKPIDKLLDCQHVKRWTLLSTATQSNVASHSFNVAMIALAIRKKMFNTLSFSDHEVAFYALMHDVDEAETGDMPTPTKEAIRKHGVEPNALFESQRLAPEPPPKIKEIIKLADLIDNYVFIRENGVGTRARVAVDEVRGRLASALVEASPDTGPAARWVLDYILERKSDNDSEERRRLEEDRERRSSTVAFLRTYVTPVVDREPLDSNRVS